MRRGPPWLDAGGVYSPRLRVVNSTMPESAALSMKSPITLSAPAEWNQFEYLPLPAEGGAGVAPGPGVFSPSTALVFVGSAVAVGCGASVGLVVGVAIGVGAGCCGIVIRVMGGLFGGGLLVSVVLRVFVIVQTTAVPEATFTLPPAQFALNVVV